MENEEMKNMNIREYSEEVRDMLERQPSKFIKYGSVAIFLMLVLLLSISLIIQYPEEKKGECVIYTDPLPEVLTIRKNAYLDDVFVNNGDIVGKGTLIALLKNPSSYKSVIRLDSMIQHWLVCIQKGDFQSIVIPKNFFQLGDLNDDFSQLYWTYQQFNVHLSHPYFKYVRTAIQRHSHGPIIHVSGISDSKGFDDYQQSFFNVLVNFTHSLNELKSRIKSWQDNNVIIASKAGRAFFPSVIFRNMELYKDRPFLYVVPLVKHYYAEVAMPQQHFETIKIGQEVNISLPGKPNDLLLGVVSELSPVVDIEGLFTIKVSINESQIKSLQNNIDLRYQLKGFASVIVGRKSLFGKMISIDR